MFLRKKVMNGVMEKVSVMQAHHHHSHFMVLFPLSYI